MQYGVTYLRYFHADSFSQIFFASFYKLSVFPLWCFHMTSILQIACTPPEAWHLIMFGCDRFLFIFPFISFPFVWSWAGLRGAWYEDNSWVWRLISSLSPLHYNASALHCTLHCHCTASALPIHCTALPVHSPPQTTTTVVFLCCSHWPRVELLCPYLTQQNSVVSKKTLTKSRMDTRVCTQFFSNHSDFLGKIQTCLRYFLKHCSVTSVKWNRESLRI